MNEHQKSEHLQLVRDFYNTLPLPLVKPGQNGRMSDRDVIKYQAYLTEAASTALYAIHTTEIVDILRSLAGLAYIAAAAIAIQGGGIADKPNFWRQDGSVLSVARIISEKINRCADGGNDNYSELYCLCAHLVRGFINADFDKSFRLVHLHFISQIKQSGASVYDTSSHLFSLKMKNYPDLSECLFE